MKRTLFVSTATLCLAVPATAATWGGGDADYGDNTAWDTFAVPLLDEDVLINAGTATNFGNLNRGAVTTINGTGTLVVEGGRFLSGTDFPATVNVEAGGTLTSNGDYFIVGTNAAGTFNQTGGTVTANLGRGFFVSDGSNTNDSVYNALGGTLNVNLGGTDVDFHVMHVGRGADNDAFTIDGAVVNVTGVSENRRLYIDRNATLQIDSGQLNLSAMRFLVVGRSDIDVAYQSKFIINGGDVSLDAEALVVGGGDAGLVEMNGGTLSATGNIWVGDGSDFGTFNQAAGDIDVAGEIVLGRQSNGDYTMTGGTLSAADILLGASTGSFTFEGGTITLAGDDTALVNEAWFFAPNGASATYSAINDLTTIIASAIVPGDTNGDGDVDNSDLQTAIANFTGPQTDPPTFTKTVADGDNNGDGAVSNIDLQAAISNFTGPIGAAPVPEPASLALLGLGGLLIARRRRP